MQPKVAIDLGRVVSQKPVPQELAPALHQPDRAKPCTTKRRLQPGEPVTIIACQQAGALRSCPGYVARRGSAGPVVHGAAPSGLCPDPAQLAARRHGAAGAGARRPAVGPVQAQRRRQVADVPVVASFAVGFGGVVGSGLHFFAHAHKRRSQRRSRGERDRIAVIIMWLSAVPSPPASSSPLLASLTLHWLIHLPRRPLTARGSTGQLRSGSGIWSENWRRLTAKAADLQPLELSLQVLRENPQLLLPGSGVADGSSY